MADETKVAERVEHKNIFDALSAFQGEMKAIEKDGKVDFKMKNSDERVTFEYTTLGKTVETINPLLGKHGLSFRHELVEKGIECILTHATTEEKLEVVNKQVIKNVPQGEGAKPNDQTTEEYDIIVRGEIRSGVLPLDLTKAEMKDVGAQITYGRRYTLGLVLGLATEEDKDAQMLDEKLEKAQNFAFNTAKKGIDNAKTVEELNKGIDILKKDLKRIEEGKKTTFGLEKEQLEGLIKVGEDKIAVLEGKQSDAPEDVPAVDGGAQGTNEPAGGAGGK